MKYKKPKFVEVTRGFGTGCATQMSLKQNYHLNPMNVMERKGFSLELWTLSDGKSSKTEFVGNVKIRRFSNGLFLFMNLFFDKNIKLIHAHLRPFIISLLVPLTLKKCVLTPHTYELGSNWFIKRISLFFMKRFDRVIALTPYERGLYIKNGLKKERVVLLPHSIDYGFFSKKPKKKVIDIRKEYGIREDDFVITSISNFRKFKNLDTMLAAFGIFNKKVENVKFIMVGINQLKNPKYKEQKNKKYRSFKSPEDIIREYNLQQKIIFTGGLGYKKVREILSISDIFVNNSDPETMGLAVYEAGSAGVPLCLSDIGSFRTVFGDRVLYSKPRDENELAKKYMVYYKNPTLREKSGTRLKVYLKKWDYHVFMKKLSKFYSDILD